MGERMEQLVELGETEWNEFEQQHKQGSMTQSVMQYKLLKKRGRKTRIVGLKRGRQIIAGCVITIDKIHGGSVITVEHGPLLDYENIDEMKAFFTALKKYVRKVGGLYVNISPNLVYQRFNNAGEPLSEANSSTLDSIERLGFKHVGFQKGMVTVGALRWQYVKKIEDMTLQDLADSYDNRVKYYLKKNRQFGVKVRRLSRSELPHFKQLTEDTANRIGFQDKDLNFYQTVFDIYGSSAYFLVAEINFALYVEEEKDVIAQLEQRLFKLKERLDIKETKKNRRQYVEYNDQKQQHIKRIEKVKSMFNGRIPDDNKIIAGALFIEQPQETVYLYSGMYDQYRDYYGPYLLQDTMLRYSVEKQIPLYNFLGITGDFSGKDGVFKFKTEFGGHAEELIGEFICPVRPVKYWFYQMVKKILHR